jgi:hypothetical protein
VVQEQQAFEFKPQLQQEVQTSSARYLLLVPLMVREQDGRKIVRARRGEAPKANKLTAEAAVR